METIEFGIATGHFEGQRLRVGLMSCTTVMGEGYEIKLLGFYYRRVQEPLNEDIRRFTFRRAAAELSFSSITGVGRQGSLDHTFGPVLRTDLLS